MRFSGGTPALRSIIAVWTSTAQRTASTTLRNLIMLPSPVRLTQPPEPRQGAILVRSREPAVADDIRDQNRRDLPGLAHGAHSGDLQNSTKIGHSRARFFGGK
jgi:hypothetical protein